MAELVRVVGRVGAGKTPRAGVLATSIEAVRLSPEGWIVPMFGHPDPDGLRDALEGRLIWTAVEALRSGAAVILDFGFRAWEERAALSCLA